MKEVELRFKINNAEYIHGKLSDLNFTLLSEKRQIDEYFKHKGFEKEGDVVGSYIYRLRTDSQKGNSAVRKKTIEPGIWDELEINIDGDNLTFIRTLMEDSLSSILVIDKYRRTYKKDDFTLNIDIIKDLGEFVEVELLVLEESNEAMKKIENLILELGVNKSDIIREGYVTLIKKEKELV
ncbi:hypothetical protein CN504_25870 [Bacillus anthracis]|nr:hypothetical protein CN504_25870 [Bacillus anthracis]